ncbi:class I SAM-dependent DNA methyltransferase [Cryobacterium sp. TMT4-10]|uniref:type I restriction-modification system subunit M n=1 Tax=Cryobacterium sp. TMT4-10 TaxID=1259256 RepID=UPI0010690AC0|nr:class I SAM-dependent DNA methyltransferase [Cryobacterium sp. TMT4-10]TFD17864.1 SAM-dependent DNA methyltransferase [Cryobacterium sp. TMT4-10]
MTLASTESHYLTQRQLENTLWAAANALRGPVDPGDFKSYVFPVMFFKWISDTWDHNHAEAFADFGDDLTDEIEATYQPFVVPEDGHWDDVFETTLNIGSKLGKTLLRIQEANPGKLDGVFGDVNWANKERLPESALADLLDAFDKLTLDPTHISGDMLGAAYEYLLREFAEASGKKAGEFFTPRHVVHLLVKILDPQPGDSVCDPACGSAGMLVETVNAVNAGGGDARTLSLYGQEYNLTTAAMAKMNLYLHGLEDFQIVRGDTFREPKLLEKDGSLRTYSAIAANPPFSLQNWGADFWARDPYARAIGGEVPPAKNGDYAWIQHIVSTMADDVGRAGIVMPHGVLFRGGKEAVIREQLVRSNLLEAIISLPNNLFYSTSIPVCLLIFRKKKSVERFDHVLFVDATKRFVAGKNQNTMSNDDIEVIHEAYRDGVDSDGDGGLGLRLVPLDEIAENGFDLNIGRYIKGEAVAEANVGEAMVLMREAQERLMTAQTELDVKLLAAGF